MSAGCVIDEPKPAAARFEVAWTFEGGGDCASVGAASVRLNMLSADGQLADYFPCEDGVGVTHPVDPGVNYSLQLTAYDAADAELGRSDARTEMVPKSGVTVEVEAFVITGLP